MKRETLFSKDRIYRFTLWRDWSEQMKDGVFFTEDPHVDYYPGTRDTFVQFIGLNPSTADENRDDPTVRRCIDYAKRWGFGAMCMTNLFAYRATDPKVMMACPLPVGVTSYPGWREVVVEVAKSAGLVVCAWGNDGAFKGRSRFVAKALRDAGAKLHHLGLNDSGEPKHPLYLKKTTTPIPWL